MFGNDKNQKGDFNANLPVKNNGFLLLGTK